MKSCLADFEEIILEDFEYSQPPGDNPEPKCGVFYLWKQDRTVRLFGDELRDSEWPGGREALHVSYYSIAEASVYLQLGRELPKYQLDLFAEFKCLTNGYKVPAGHSLLGALAFYGLPGVETEFKESMRELAMRDGPYTAEEKLALLDYCQTDVDALRRLLPVMLPKIHLGQALIRGRYSVACAVMEHIGTPIDTKRFSYLRDHWSDCKLALIAEVDKDYGVYDGESFREKKFIEYLIREQIPWPRLPSGRPETSDETFSEQMRIYPQLRGLRDLRYALGKLKLHDIRVGKDGRNRTMLSPFGAKTGRNTPSNSEFIMGPAAWIRRYIAPEPGTALIYADFEQQEFGIAAALSKDAMMMKAYQSGDSYLSFAKQCRAVPEDATKDSHGPVRERYKTICLALQYGGGPKTVAEKLCCTTDEAAELLRDHHRTYFHYWKWVNNQIDIAFLSKQISTVFGWKLHVNGTTTYRTLQNFPMQSNGSEILRLAACLLTESGVRVCCPCHDAFLIEAPISDLDDVIDVTGKAMTRASELVLGGFPIRVETKVIRYPEHFEDRKGLDMWKKLSAIIPREFNPSILSLGA